MDMAEINSRYNSDNGSIDVPAALESHRRWLRTVVWARVNDLHAVDEIMQEVSLAAVRERSLTVDAGCISACLYRVAVRQSLLYRRRMGRDGRRVSRYRDHRRQDDDCATGGNPLRWLLAEEEMELVRKALCELSAKDRELLLLKYTEDWTCRELAERLGVSVTTVETRLYRARERLRNELARLDVIEEQP
jgi:RNA polymerase sigma-70 factor (ECF subfamily)